MTRIFLIHILALLIPFSTQQYDFDFSQLEGNSLFTDIANCANHEDVSTCPSVTMKSGYYQCCRFHMSIQYYDYDLGDMSLLRVKIYATFGLPLIILMSK